MQQYQRAVTREGHIKLNHVGTQTNCFPKRRNRIFRMGITGTSVGTNTTRWHTFPGIQALRFSALTKNT